MENRIEVYTDGSRVSNADYLINYGWAYIIPELNVCASGKVYDKDSNTCRMELTAVVEAMRYIATHKGDYVLYCDNLPIVKCFEGRGSRKIYKDLWSQVYVLVDQARKIGSTLEVKFLNRKELDQNSKMFKHAQTVDKLAFMQANSLCIVS